MLKINSIAALDLAKFVFSFFVVAIHTSPLYQTSYWGNFIIIQYLGRYAVPFFFIASGYFMAQNKNLQFEIKNIFSQLKRILILYAVWSLIYFPFQLNNTHHDLFKTIDFDSIKEYFIRSIYLSSYYHLWYFVALIQAVLIYKILSHYFKLETLIIVFIPIYLFGLLGDGYFNLNNYLHANDIIFFIKLHLGGTRNGLFMGTIFVLIGAKIAELDLDKIKTNKALMLFVLLAIAHLAEVIFIKQLKLGRDYNMTIFLLPSATVLFVLLIKSQINLRFSTLKLREYSTFIYCFHPLAMILASAFAFNTNSLMRYFFVVIVSLIVAIIMSEQHKNIKKYFV